MSEGLLALRAAIETRSREALRQIQRPMLTPDEDRAYVILEAMLRRYGEFPTVQIMEEVGVTFPPPDNPPQPVRYYLDRLHQRTMFTTVRNLIGTATESLRAQDAVSAADAVIAAARELNTIQVSEDVTTLHAASEDVFRGYQMARVNPEASRGIPLGFPTIDEATNGIQPGELWTYVARPNVGKSFLMVHSAIVAWMAGHAVLFVSMEMETVQISRRALARNARLNPDHLKRGQLSRWGEEAVHDALVSIEHGPPFHILAGNLEKRVAEVDSLVQEVQPALLAVDAAYMLDTEHRTNYTKGHERIEQTTKELTGLALARRIPALQSVQFNRDGAKDRNQGMEAIAGSDAISKNSAGIIAISEAEPGVVQGRAEQFRRELTTLKVRDGRKPPKININFRLDPWDFSEIAEDNNALDENGERVAEQRWRMD